MKTTISKTEYDLLSNMRIFGANWLKFNFETSKWEIRRSKTDGIIAEFYEWCFTFYRLETHYISNLIDQYN